MFMWDACKDMTLIVLMVAAMASLALGIKSEVRLPEKVMMRFFVVILQEKSKSCRHRLWRQWTFLIHTHKYSSPTLTLVLTAFFN